jgi:hypothetical protein
VAAPHQGVSDDYRPEREASFVRRVKAGTTPRDGVASLRGPPIPGIQAREFGKIYSRNGIYESLNRHGSVGLKPRPRHPRQDPAAAKAFKRSACGPDAGTDAS